MGGALYGQQAACLGSTKNYWVDIAENSGNGSTGSDYSWTVLETGFKGSITPTTISGNQITINWAETPSGSYTLEVTETNRGCTSTQQLEVRLMGIFSSLPAEYKICAGSDPITIDAGGGGGYSYAWTVPAGAPNPGNVPSFSTNIPGAYSVSVSNGACDQTFKTDLEVSDLPAINKIREIGSGGIEIFATGGNPPLYYSIDGANWQTSNVFANLSPGAAYVARVKNALGCLGENKSFTVLFIPNAITPQADGINDQLHIKGIENFSKAHLQIYDRYGKIIFDSDREKTFGWNGTYLGRPVPSASYWYVMDLGDGGEKKTGYIVVKNRN